MNRLLKYIFHIFDIFSSQSQEKLKVKFCDYSIKSFLKTFLSVWLSFSILDKN